MVDDVGLEARVEFSGGADVADVLEFSLCFHLVLQIRSQFFRIYRPGGHRNGGFYGVTDAGKGNLRGTPHPSKRNAAKSFSQNTIAGVTEHIFQIIRLDTSKTQNMGDIIMFQDFNELPTVLNAKELQSYLGISKTSTYELMHREDFPTLHISSRLLVTKKNLRAWLIQNTNPVEGLWASDAERGL